jgi:hypothetical protein
MTPKKSKAERRRYKRALAKDLQNRSLPSPGSLTDPPFHTMSSDRRDSSSRRAFSPPRPFSPPRGPRAEYQNDDPAYYFTSDKVRPQRDRNRERSRSRSPDSSRRRPERYDSYKFRGEADRRPLENNYRPIYDDSPTRPPPLIDGRREYKWTPQYSLILFYSHRPIVSHPNSHSLTVSSIIQSLANLASRRKRYKYFWP